MLEQQQSCCSLATKQPGMGVGVGVGVVGVETTNVEKASTLLGHISQ
jgi:hypothetical protein